MNRAALKECIKDSGMTMAAISRKSGINQACLYYKLRTETSEFTASEIVALSKTLGMTRSQRDDIFLT